MIFVNADDLIKDSIARFFIVRCLLLQQFESLDFLSSDVFCYSTLNRNCKADVFNSCLFVYDCATLPYDNVYRPIGYI